MYVQNNSEFAIYMNMFSIYNYCKCPLIKVFYLNKYLDQHNPENCDDKGRI